MVILDVLSISSSPPAQRARGAARVVARAAGAGSVIGELRQSGSSKLLFPRPRGRSLDVVTLNTAGGVTGGDEFELAAGAPDGAQMTISTQAAERIYRALPGQTGRVTTQLQLGDGARLNWLPQETILFDGAALRRSLRIDMAASAQLLACEALVFGRTAMQERVTDLWLRDRIDLFRDGQLVFFDRLRLDGDAQSCLTQAAVANGGLAMASVLWAAPDAETALGGIRADLPETAGAGSPVRDLVFVRIVASDSFELRKTLVPLLTRLSNDPLPRTWTI
ncbi:MAG: urease accessory protein UreD [Rhodobacteraceae bacterium]|nr:urease accessory protein UreD [Paracoccaceae bacterium]